MLSLFVACSYCTYKYVEITRHLVRQYSALSNRSYICRTALGSQHLSRSHSLFLGSRTSTLDMTAIVAWGLDKLQCCRTG